MVLINIVEPGLEECQVIEVEGIEAATDNVAAFLQARFTEVSSPEHAERRIGELEELFAALGTMYTEASSGKPHFAFAAFGYAFSFAVA